MKFTKRGNESCYDNGGSVFDAAELLDFAEYCLKHGANGAEKRTEPALHKHVVNASALLLDAKNWWANECWHKDFDKLTRLQKTIINSDLKMMKIYLENLHLR